MKMGMKFWVFEVDGSFGILFSKIKTSSFAFDISPLLPPTFTISADHLQISAKGIKLKTVTSACVTNQRDKSSL